MIGRRVNTRTLALVVAALVAAAAGRLQAQPEQQPPQPVREHEARPFPPGEQPQPPVPDGGPGFEPAGQPPHGSRGGGPRPPMPPPFGRERAFGGLPGTPPQPPLPPRELGRDRSRAQVYFVKPKVGTKNQLFDLAKIIDRLGIVASCQVDQFSGNLILQCEPEQFAQVQKVVDTLASGRAGSSDPSTQQLALEVRVYLADPKGEAAPPAGLDPKLLERLTQLFGYKSLRLLGTQSIRVQVGEHASSETYFKDPGSERVFPFSLGFNVDPAGDQLRIRAGLKALDQGAVISTTFLARPDQGVVLGNSSLKSGEALVYLLTPRGE